MNPEVVNSRRDICADCPTPCALQLDATAHADPRQACPLPSPRWTRWGRGDALAATIERRILAPIEQRIPSAAPLVAVARRCGGCKSGVAQLNGDSNGSRI